MNPSGFPEVQEYPNVKRFLQNHVDMLFEDLRVMLRLPVGDFTAGLNFPALSTICAIIAGASVCFYDNESGKAFESRGDRRTRFLAVLNRYYPDLETINAACQVDFAKMIWKYLRNPLEHSLGIFLREEGFEKGLSVAKPEKGLTSEKIEELETSGIRQDRWPLKIQQTGIRYDIQIPALYWGLHRLLHNLFGDRTQMEEAERSFAR